MLNLLLSNHKPRTPNTFPIVKQNVSLFTTTIETRSSILPLQRWQGYRNHELDTSTLFVIAYLLAPRSMACIYVCTILSLDLSGGILNALVISSTR